MRLWKNIFSKAMFEKSMNKTLYLGYKKVKSDKMAISFSFFYSLKIQVTYRIARTILLQIVTCYVYHAL